MKQLLSSIAHLHKQFICHRDIKVENLMIAESDDGTIQLKLIDFNISMQCDKDFLMLSSAGTEIFKAPEMVAGKNFNEKVDLWGAGCVLCYLLTGKMPMNGAQASSFASSMYDFEDISKLEKLKPEADNLASDLALKLLAPTPDERISAEEALRHPWLKD